MNQKLVLFDFDGTLIKKDSFWLMIWHNQSKFKIILAALKYFFPFLLARNNHKKRSVLKEKVFSHFFKECSVGQFDLYCKNILKYIIIAERKEMVGKLINHKAQGSTVVILSASMPNWINKWATLHDVDFVIGTEPEIIGNKLTGKFSSNNCNGIEKVLRLEKEIRVSDYEITNVYGNSSGDEEMLKLVTQSQKKIQSFFP